MFCGLGDELPIHANSLSCGAMPVGYCALRLLKEGDQIVMSLDRAGVKAGVNVMPEANKFTE